MCWEMDVKKLYFLYANQGGHDIIIEAVPAGRSRCVREALPRALDGREYTGTKPAVQR